MDLVHKNLLMGTNYKILNSGLLGTVAISSLKGFVSALQMTMGLGGTFFFGTSTLVFKLFQLESAAKWCRTYTVRSSVHFKMGFAFLIFSIFNILSGGKWGKALDKYLEKNKPVQKNITQQEKQPNSSKNLPSPFRDGQYEIVLFDQEQSDNPPTNTNLGVTFTDQFGRPFSNSEPVSPITEDSEGDESEDENLI